MKHLFLKNRTYKVETPDNRNKTQKYSVNDANTHNKSVSSEVPAPNKPLSRRFFDVITCDKACAQLVELTQNTHLWSAEQAYNAISPHYNVSRANMYDVCYLANWSYAMFYGTVCNTEEEVIMAAVAILRRLPDISYIYAAYCATYGA